MCSNRKQVHGCLGRRVWHGERQKGGHRTCWRVRGMFMILIGVIILLVYTYVKAYQIVYFKYVQFIGCQLYLNKAIQTKIMHLQSWLAVSLFSLIAPWLYVLKLWAGAISYPGLDGPLGPSSSSQVCPGHSQKTFVRGRRSAVISLYILQERLVSSVHHRLCFAHTRPSWCSGFNNNFLFTYLLKFSYGCQYKSNHLTQINSTNIFFQHSLCKTHGRYVWERTYVQTS